HPLIEPALRSTHVHHQSWPPVDSNPHGTEMAGLCLYGEDLAGMLERGEPAVLSSWVESVRIYPPEGLANDPRLYGSITQAAVAGIEVEEPLGPRVFCLAISSTDTRDHGLPSSWSAAVDHSASGADDDVRRLFVVSAGNMGVEQQRDYPESNRRE